MNDALRFDIITIFPHAFDSYFDESIIKRAKEKKLLEIKIHNLRDFAQNKHKRVALRQDQGNRESRRTIDDRPYGGGAGMVLMAEPLIRAAGKIAGRKRTGKVVLMSARGKQFTQAMARDWAGRYKEVVILCGHYEGVDERVRKILRAEEICIGPYILTGGELAAMVVVDAVARHLPGVLGKKESLEEVKGSYPVYTRPEVFWHQGKARRVPAALLSGNHKRIAAWRSDRAPEKATRKGGI